MSGLSNVQIISIAGLHYHTKNYFAGCFCTDTLPLNVAKYPSFVICNTDSSLSGGEHWIAMCFKSRHDIADYFDSMGEDLTTYDSSLLNFIVRNSNGRYRRSKYRYQSEHSDRCGHYCLWFGDMRCKNVPFETCLLTLDKEDHAWNDYYVTEYVMQHMRPGYV